MYIDESIHFFTVTLRLTIFFLWAIWIEEEDQQQSARHSRIQSTFKHPRDLKALVVRPSFLLAESTIHRFVLTFFLKLCSLLTSTYVIARPQQTTTTLQFISTEAASRSQLGKTKKNSTRPGKAAWCDENNTIPSTSLSLLHSTDNFLTQTIYGPNKQLAYTLIPSLCLCSPAAPWLISL
jgi:hypothetical protein